MRRWTCSIVFTTSPTDPAFCLLLLSFHPKIAACSIAATLEEQAFLCWTCKLWGDGVIKNIKIGVWFLDCEIWENGNGSFQLSSVIKQVFGITFVTRHLRNDASLCISWWSHLQARNGVILRPPLLLPVHVLHPLSALPSSYFLLTHSELIWFAVLRFARRKRKMAPVVLFLIEVWHSWLNPRLNSLPLILILA